TVQPKTLPPNTSGAIARPEPPKLRFSMIAPLPKGLFSADGAAMHQGPIRTFWPEFPAACQARSSMIFGNELHTGACKGGSTAMQRVTITLDEEFVAELDRVM